MPHAPYLPPPLPAGRTPAYRKWIRCIGFRYASLEKLADRFRLRAIYRSKGIVVTFKIELGAKPEKNSSPQPASSEVVESATSLQSIEARERAFGRGCQMIQSDPPAFALGSQSTGLTRRPAECPAARCAAFWWLAGGREE